MMQAMTFASMRHLDGNDHTRLQADDTSTSTIPSRYWSTTYWTPAQISGQFKISVYNGNIPCCKSGNSHACRRSPYSGEQALTTHNVATWREGCVGR